MAAPLIRYTLIGAFLCVFLPLPTFAQITRINLPQSFPVLQTGNQLWIGTPSGLYQYNQSDDSYKRFAPPNARSDFHVRYLYAYKEWLWCVMDSGLAALQIRLNDWLVFDSTNGLPSPDITGIDFQEDYVWISTRNGAARFDLLIEQWEQFDQKRGLPSSNVADIKSDGENIWMLTENSLFEYSPQFEKWRTFEAGGDSVSSARRLFLFSDNIWIVSDRGLVRFNPKLQQRQEFFLPYLDSKNLIEIYLEGDKIWAVSRGGLYYYEQQSGVWTEFEGNVSLRDMRINFAQITQKQIWVLAEKGMMVWDRDLRTWETLDYSSGLSLASYNSVSSDGDLTFLFTPQSIEYRKTQQNPWRKFLIEASGAESGERNILGRMFDNPEGGSIQLGDYLWNWQGTRATYIQDYASHMNGGTTTTQSSAWRLDIKSQLELGSGRRVTGFYNNMDYAETKYGARYRGNDSDYVREVMWGDFRREPGTVPFGQAAELYGTNIWLQAGPKTERFKRSLVSLKATAGEIRSRKTYENFKGASTEFSRSIRDSDFLQNQFFTLPGTDSTHRPDELEIFIDDSLAGDDNLRTLKGATIAGVTGDYDPWIPAEEFYFYPRGGTVRLLKPVMSNWIVVARYRIGDAVRESVLQNGVFSTAQNSFYFLGAQEILPYSFAFNIKDTIGNSVSLNNYGIDDGSGRVDARWIDYDAGILKFPNPLNLNSRYTFEVKGQTQRTIILLGHQNLVRGSETLRLDDTPAEPGNDFVLDYTNGTLIFVREGIVNPDTRIEIEYEYYESTGNQLASASLNIAPSDQFYLQGDWQKLSEDSTHLISLHGELRQQVGSFDVRLIPGAVYQTNEQKLTGTSAEALVSSKWLRLQSKYEQYDSTYRNIHRDQSVVGDISKRFNFFGSLDIREDLRLSGEWKQTEGFVSDTLRLLSNNSPTDRTGNVSVLYHGTDLPAAQVTYQDGSTKIGDSTESKQFLQSTVEYQIPKLWASAISLQGVKAEYFLRYGTQSDNSASGFLKQDFLQTYYKLNAIISEQFQTGFFYRRNTLHDAASSDSKNPITSSDRLLGDIAFGEWRFMQVNARLENTLQQDYYRGGDSLTYYARQFYQVNTRLSPGQVWDKLSSLFFEVTYNQSVSQSDIAPASTAPSVWRINAPDYSGSGSYVQNRNTFVKNEFRPNADWLVSTLVEWNTQHSELGSTGLDRNSWQLTEKVDVRPGYMTHLIAQYRRISQDQGFNRTNQVHEPSLWVEQRWTDDLLSTAQIIYRRTGIEDRTVSALLHEWEGLLDLVLRKDQWLGMHHVEFHQSLSGSNQRQEGIPVLQTYRLGTTTSLDLYPLYSLIVRLRFDWNQFVDEIVDAGTYSTLNFTLKVSLQL
jgi:hypothetical protein